MNIPTGLTSIGDSVFLACKSLPSITIPGNVISIGDHAFYSCFSLSKVTITNSVVNIGHAAFYYCTNLPSITIHSSVTNIGAEAFENCGLTNITIPGSVICISEQAFFNCSSLASVTISNGVISIGDSAFESCDSLTGVTIPGSVTSIGHGAFQDCQSLMDVTIPNGVTSIGEQAFDDCSMTNITIPGSVTNIGSSAFAFCFDLANVTISNGVTSIGGGAFSYSGLQSITIPGSVAILGDRTFSFCSSLTNVIFSNGVVSIGKEAFWSCSKLRSVAIPGSVTSIKDGTFKFCNSLTSVTIPYGVTNIGAVAFYECMSLPNVTIPSSVTSIGRYAFYWCNSFTTSTIPDGVSGIDEFTFYHCTNLHRVTIPGSVTNIGDSAFASCFTLTKVCFEGNAPSIGSGLFNDSDNVIVYHLSGTTGWPTIPDVWSDRPTALCPGTPVVITDEPQSCTNNPGIPASFTVTATGTARRYQWQKNTFNIGLATNAIYTIASVGTGDAGGYRCLVSNILNAVTSMVATLSVNTAAVITDEPQSCTNDPGTPAAFTVTATGTTPLYYQWQKNTINISGATEFNYTIGTVQESDEGNYRCIVTNIAGGATSAVAMLRVNNLPGIGLSTTLLTYAATYGGSSPVLQTLIMTNLGQVAFSYSNAVVYGAQAVGWFNLVPVTGLLVDGAGQVLTGAVNLVSLTVGVYYATNMVIAPTATNSPKYISVVLTVSKASQTITTFIPTNGSIFATTNTVGLSATGGGSTNPVLFSVTNGAGVISGFTNLTFTGTGSVSIVASQAGDTNYIPAPSLTNTFTVTKASQAALVFNPTSPQTYNTTNALTTSGGSGTGAVSYVIQSGPGQIVGGTNLKMTAGTGTGVVVATKAADAMYSVQSATGQVVAAKAAQAITFPTISDQVASNKVGLSATASSGLPVAFAVGGGLASISGGTNLSFTGTGSVSIVASQAGNTNWNAAPNVTNTFNVTKASQVALVFNPTSTQAYNTTNAFTTSGGSGTGAVSYAVQSGPCQIVSGTNLKMTASTGTGVVVATKAADAMYSVQSATGQVVAAKAAQVITFPTIPTQITTNNVGLSATADSGLPVAFAVGSGPAGISGGTNLTFTGTGSVSIVASQSGDTNYHSAPSLTNTFNVTKANQAALVFNPTSPQTYNTTNALTTSGGSGTGAVSYAVQSGPGQIVSGTNLKMTAGTGTGVVVATKAADAMYVVISKTGQVVAVKANQTITFPTISDQVASNKVGLSATASSGLPVAFAVGGGLASISGGTNLSFTGTGAVSIVASQAGNTNWNAASNVTNTFNVTKANQAALVFNPTSPQTYNTTNALTTSGGSGSGVVSYAVQSGPGQIVSGTNLKMTAGSGTGVVVATQAADAMYNVRSVTGQVVAAKASQVITFPTIPDQVASNKVGLSATASSSLTVAFAVTSGLAQITGSTNLTFTGTGLVSIVASQTGNTNWSAAPNVTNTFNVTKANQAALVFNPTSPQTYNTTNALTTSGGSGSGVVSYAVQSGPGQIVSGTSLKMTAGTGTGLVVATKAADAMYMVISKTGQVVAVKANQTITFPTIPDQVASNKVGLSATASSGLPVAFAVGGGLASISGGTNLTFTGTGAVSIVASQAGNTNWNAASNVTNTFNVTKASQAVLVFNPTTPQTYNTTNVLTTSGGSGSGAVSYAVQSGPGQIVSGTSLKMTAGTGTGMVVATKAADTMYYVLSATGQVVATKASQAITNFTPTNGSAFATTSTVMLAAHASSGLPVTLALVSGPGQLAGTNLTFTNAGSVSIVASQAGNTNWSAAASMTNTFNVTKVVAKVTLSNLTYIYDGNAKTATVTTIPSGLMIDMTYAGNNWAPTNVGNYAVTAVVNDAFYQGSTNGTLTINTLPAPVAQSAALITPSNFVANWSAVSTATNYFVDVASTNHFSSYLGGFSNYLAGAALSCTVTGVSIGNTCYYRVRAQNSGMTSTNSGIISVAIQNVPSLGATSVSNTMAHTAYLGGSITVTNGYSVTERGVYWGTNAGSVRAEGVKYSESGSFGTGTFSFLVTNLPAGRTNYFVAYAVNVLGTNFTGESPFLTRPDAPVILPPTNITANNLYANWQSAESATNYWLDVSATNNFTMYLSGYSNRAAGSALTYPVTGLTARVIYYYWVRAENSTGVGTNSAVMTVSKGAIGLSPVSVSFGYIYGGTNPTEQSFVITNSGYWDFNFTNRASYSSGASGWWRATPSTGNLAGVSCLSIAANVTVTGLNAGTYYVTNAIISSEATNSPQYLVATLAVSKGEQAITNFTPTSGSSFETTDEVHLLAQASSGLAVTNFTVISGPGVISGLTNLSFTNSGVVIVTAEQAGNTNWNAAPTVTNTFNMVKTTASITLTGLSQTYDGTPRVVGAITVPGGLSVNITYNGSGSAPTAVGNYAVKGTVNSYLYQGSANGTLTVNKADHTITFPIIPDQVTTNTVGLSATASSGLPVSFAVSSGLGSINGGATLTFTGAGSVSIVVSQAGDVSWNPAPNVTNTFNVIKANQTITFPVIPDQMTTSQVTLAAMASSGLAASFSVESGPGAIDGDVLTFTGAGVVQIVARQGGNALWNAAANVTNNITVHRVVLLIPLSGDFDGDLKNDLVLYQKSSGCWSFQLSASDYAGVCATLGGPSYQPISTDFDSDNKADPAVYDTTTGGWAIMLSGSSYSIAYLPKFGGVGFLPVVGDYDGDHKADPAWSKENAGTWMIKLSGSGYGAAVLSGFGGAGYTAMALDFDGDGKVDPAIYQDTTGDWTVKLSGSSYAPAYVKGFGGPGYLLVSGMYDNDTRADAGIYNPANGNWTILLSAGAYITADLIGFGGEGYTPVVGDFDGDGKVDPALYQASTSTWFVKLSGSGYITVQAQQ